MQIGHCELRRSHASMQRLWYTCKHGKVRSSSPLLKASMQIMHLRDSSLRLAGGAGQGRKLNTLRVILPSREELRYEDPLEMCRMECRSIVRASTPWMSHSSSLLSSSRREGRLESQILLQMSAVMAPDTAQRQRRDDCPHPKEDSTQPPQLPMRAPRNCMQPDLPRKG